MLTGIAAAVEQVQPQVVLVYGDTNSTLAGALAAAKLNVPIAHVEAGLRSFDRRMPEEVNRVLTDHVSSLLFCPTDTAVENLRREGVVAGVVQTGDVMFDLAMATLTPAREQAVLDRFGVRPGGYVLATAHRPATTDVRECLKAVLDGLGASSEPVVFPVHPRTSAAIARHGLAGSVAPNVKLTAPVGYLESLTLAKNARVVATDSGGLQKEAYFFAVPCVTMRDTSEWVETMASGWNVLVGTDLQPSQTPWRARREVRPIPTSTARATPASVSRRLSARFWRGRRRERRLPRDRGRRQPPRDRPPDRRGGTRPDLRRHRLLRGVSTRPWAAFPSPPPKTRRWPTCRRRGRRCPV